MSKFGDQCNLLALPLLILTLTHSPFALGVAEAANLVPYLLLGLPAGALIDRLPRRIVMIVCDIARTLTFAVLTGLLLSGWLTGATVWAIYVAVALTAVATIFFDMAHGAVYSIFMPAGERRAHDYCSGGLAEQA